MRANGEITEEEFRGRKVSLIREKHRYETLLHDTGERVDAWLETAERGFNFAENAKTTFANGEVQTKKQICAALGSNFTLTDKKLSICWDDLLFSLKTSAIEVQAIYRRFGPEKHSLTKGEIGQLYAHSPNLLRGLDDVRTLCQRMENPLRLPSVVRT